MNSVLLLYILACIEEKPIVQFEPANEPNHQPSPTETGQPIETEDLTDMEKLNRISMALRGIRPTVAEYQEMLDGSISLQEFAAGFSSSPFFIETLQEMWADILLMRGVQPLPQLDVLADRSNVEIHKAIAEEPLNLIKQIVMEGRPFTEIVTANWTVLNEVSAHIWNDHNYDHDLGGYQKVSYTDDRPMAGILTTNGFLVRHSSNGANHHRSRANMISQTFLCHDIANSDIPLTGSISNPDEAIMTNPSCTGCHSILDPLAAHFWGHRKQLLPSFVHSAYNDNCSAASEPCYPITMYSAEQGDDWTHHDSLRAPGYFDATSTDLQSLGQHLAADSLFPSCMVTHFVKHLTQREQSSFDDNEINALTEIFIDSNYDVQVLAANIVLQEKFLTKSITEGTEEVQDELIVGLQIMRPYQLERTILELTGFAYESNITYGENSPHGETLLTSDERYGYRTMFGGVDGSNIHHPTHAATPTKLLVLRAMAEETAGYVINTDLSSTGSGLLNLIDSNTENEEIIRAQLVLLHQLLFAEQVDSSSSEVNSTYTLFTTIYSNSGDISRAWSVVLSAMLQSPQFLYY